MAISKKPRQAEMHFAERALSKSDWDETDVVIQCARSVLSGDGGEVRASLAGVLESANEWQVCWVELERLADRHAVTPLFAHGLLQFGGDSVPGNIRARLQGRLRLTAENNLRWLAEWCRMAAAFEGSGIPVISLKGPMFTLQAYGNLALREFGDLDFLVQPLNVLRARDVLTAEGYRPRITAGSNDDGIQSWSNDGQMEFVHSEKGTQIDLHWSALHTMFPFQLPTEDLFRTSRMSRYEEIQFLSLSPEYALLYLCAHGTKHCWMRLRWLCDLGQYLRTSPDLDWDRVISLAEETKCGLVAGHSLLLAGAILGVELRERAGAFGGGEEIGVLADVARSFLLCGKATPSRMEELRYHWAFAKNWRDQLHLLHRRILAPAEPDWSAVRLPRQLRPLYYVIRPGRFIFERFFRPRSRTI